MAESLSYFRDDRLFNPYIVSPIHLYKEYIDEEMIQKIIDYKEKFNSMIGKIKEIISDNSDMTLTEIGSFSNFLMSIQNCVNTSAMIKKLENSMLPSHVVKHCIRTYSANVDKNISLPINNDFYNLLKNDIKMIKKYIHNIFKTNLRGTPDIFSIMFITKDDIPICSYNFDGKIFLCVEEFCKLLFFHDNENFSKFEESFLVSFKKWYDYCNTKIDKIFSLTVHDLDEDIVALSMKEILAYIEEWHSGVIGKGEISDIISQSFRNLASNKDRSIRDREIENTLKTNRMYKEKILQYERQIQINRNSAALEGLQSCMNIFSGFLMAGYEIDDELLVKKIEIRPVVCFKGGKLMRIKEEYRKGCYIKDLKMKLNKESIMHGIFYTNEQKHPNVGSGYSICIGDLSNTWANMYRDVSSITSYNFRNLLLSIEEALTVPNLDSSFYQIESEYLDSNVSDAETILVTSKKAGKKVGRVLS